MNNIIVGPSHAVRYEHAVRSKSVYHQLPKASIVGLGGAPSWSEYLYEKTKSQYKMGDSIHFIIGDFRFGNMRLGEQDNKALFMGNNIAIDSNFISPKNDQDIYDFHIRGLEKWHRDYDSINMIPWTPIMRRSANISQGFHITAEGKYQHPICNDHYIIQSYCNPGFLEILETPPSILNLFFIDDDLHPSTLGYLFLNDCFLKKQPIVAIKSCQEKLSIVVNNLLSDLNIREKIIIYGESISIPTLCKVLPFNTSLIPSIKCHFGPLPPVSTDSIEIELESVKSTGVSDEYRGNHFRIKFPWDYFGYNVLSRKHSTYEKYRPKPESFEKSAMLELYNAFDDERLFDLGMKLSPTLLGAFLIISLASQLPPPKRMEIIEHHARLLFS